MDQFVCRLQQRAVTCDFTDVDKTIRDQLIEKCIDLRLRHKFLEKTNATLADLQRIARAHEAVNEQMKRTRIQREEICTEPQSTKHKVQGEIHDRGVTIVIILTTLQEMPLASQGINGVTSVELMDTFLSDVERKEIKNLYPDGIRMTRSHITEKLTI